MRTVHIHKGAYIIICRSIWCDLSLLGYFQTWGEDRAVMRGSTQAHWEFSFRLLITQHWTHNLAWNTSYFDVQKICLFFWVVFFSFVNLNQTQRVAVKLDLSCCQRIFTSNEESVIKISPTKLYFWFFYYS